MNGKAWGVFKDADFFIGFLAILFFWFFCLNYPVYLAADGVEYLSGARFISRGLGYVIYGELPQQLVPQVDSPPFFSFLISCMMKIGKINEVDACKVVNFLSLILYYGSYSCIVKLIFGKKFYRVLAIFFVINSPIVWRYTNFALTEVLFSGIFGLLFLACLKAMCCEIKAKRNLLFLIGGFIAMSLCLTRYAGAYIVIAFAAAFLFMKNLFGWKQKLTEVFYFGAPVAIGLGGWFLRNHYVGRQLYYLKTIPERLFMSNLFALEGRFLDTITGVLIQGTPLSDLRGYGMRFLATILFSVFAAVFLRLLWKKWRNIFVVQARSCFFVLVFCVFITYISVNNLTWLIQGFGITPRFFYVLFPAVWITVMLVISGALDDKGDVCTKRPFLITSALLSAVLFSNLCHAVTGWNYFLSTANQIKKGFWAGSKIYVPAFNNAHWIFQLIRDNAREDVVFLSNQRLYLSYMADRSCGPITMLQGGKAEMMDRLGLKDKNGEAGRQKVFVIWQKEPAASSVLPVDLKKYLEGFEYQILRQDDYAVAIELLMGGTSRPG